MSFRNVCLLLIYPFVTVWTVGGRMMIVHMFILWFSLVTAQMLLYEVPEQILLFVIGSSYIYIWVFVFISTLVAMLGAERPQILH